MYSHRMRSFVYMKYGESENRMGLCRCAMVACAIIRIGGSVLSEHNNGLTERHTYVCALYNRTWMTSTVVQQRKCIGVLHQQRRCVFKSLSVPVRVCMCVCEARKTWQQMRKYGRKTANLNEFKKGKKWKQIDAIGVLLSVLVLAAQVSARGQCMNIKQSKTVESIRKEFSFFVSYGSQSFARRISELRM